jgi:hypothetical protein
MNAKERKLLSILHQHAGKISAHCRSSTSPFVVGSMRAFTSSGGSMNSVGKRHRKRDRNGFRTPRPMRGPAITHGITNPWGSSNVLPDTDRNEKSVYTCFPTQIAPRHQDRTLSSASGPGAIMLVKIAVASRQRSGPLTFLMSFST